MLAQQIGHEIAEQNRTSKGSYWPIIVAAGLAITLAGLVVHPVVSVFGALIFLVTLIAWNLERFHGPSEAEAVRGELATTAPAKGKEEPLAAEAEGSRSGRWGLFWFITSEAVFFGNLIAAYLYLRVRSADWPQSEHHLEILFPIINTVILLGSSIPSYYSHQAIKKGNQRGLQIGLGLAALLGAIFLGGQAYEYSKLGFTPQTNTFGAGFFVLTGFHGAHVLAGIGLLLIMLVLSLRGRFTAQHNFPVEFATTYWHFVDVVWIFLFTIFYVLQ